MALRNCQACSEAQLVLLWHRLVQKQTQQNELFMVQDVIFHPLNYNHSFGHPTPRKQGCVTSKRWEETGKRTAASLGKGSALIWETDLPLVCINRAGHFFRVTLPSSLSAIASYQQQQSP